jgi:hypothetical protein
VSEIEALEKQPVKLSTVLAACEHTRTAWGWLNDSIVSAFELLPIAGQDLGASRTILSSFSEICEPASKLLVSFDETNPLTSISSLKSGLLRSLGLETLARFDAAESRIRAIDAHSLHFGLASKVANAQTSFARFKKIAPEIERLVSVAAAVLSNSEPNRWLIATQNLAEARGTGGILGSFAVVRFDETGPHLEEAGSDQTLADYGPVVYESLPIDTATMWGVEPNLWQDINPSSHAPYAANQIYDSWLRYKGQKLAGVIFVGQGWAQNVVGLLGSAQVNGVRLDSSNTADFLAKGIYSKYPDVFKKNDFVKQLMVKLGARLSTGKLDFKGFIQALEGNLTGDKLFAWAKDS